MDNGVVVTIGAGWILPPGYPNFSSTWIEVVGSNGALMVDDTHRDVALLRMGQPGAVAFPHFHRCRASSAGHVFAGPMAGETAAFVEDVVRDREPLVTPEQALLAMEVYTAADLSIERGEAVHLPLPRNPQAERLSLSLMEGTLCMGGPARGETRGGERCRGSRGGRCWPPWPVRERLPLLRGGRRRRPRTPRAIRRGRCASSCPSRPAARRTSPCASSSSPSPRRSASRWWSRTAPAPRAMSAWRRQRVPRRTATRCSSATWVRCRSTRASSRARSGCVRSRISRRSRWCRKRRARWS